jgi:cysteine synthase A
VWAALQEAREVGPGGRVVTILPDGGARYLSTALYSDDGQQLLPTGAEAV